MPLRRVAQSYVIATGTTLDVSKIKVPAHLNDEYFKREPKKKKRTEDMFEDTPEVCIPLEQLLKQLIYIIKLLFNFNSKIT